MDTVLFAAQLAQQTGGLLREHFSRSGTPVTRKADHSVVTALDVVADQLIGQAIQAQFPDDGILSEELYSTLPAGPGVVWVVDPLDGTTNFSLGLHHWGVSIARCVNGRPETAALYFPLLDELYTARLGQGAFLNGERIRVQPPYKDQPAAFFSCCSRTHHDYVVRVPYKTRILGSSAYSLCVVGRGAALLAFEATPKAWDLAAGWLVASEAGASLSTLDGSRPFPLSSDVDHSQRSYPVLAAATPELIEKARRWIVPKDL